MNLWDKNKRKRLSARVSKWFKNIWSHVGWDDYSALVILLIGGLGYWFPRIAEWSKFYMDIRSELIGIGVSVLIIANAGETISRKQEKKRLILQMGSPDNAFALDAVRQLEARGWLRDGSLRGVFLLRSALSRADLTGADLTEAILDLANLSGAILFGANLSGANLRGANLTEAILGGANLSSSTLRYTNLRGAKYNEYTTWPKGFDPDAAGAVLVESYFNPLT